MDDDWEKEFLKSIDDEETSLLNKDAKSTFTKEKKLSLQST